MVFVLLMESLLRLPRLGGDIGNIGANTAKNSSLDPSYTMSPHFNNPSSPQLLLDGSGQDESKVPLVTEVLLVISKTI